MSYCPLLTGKHVLYILYLAVKHVFFLGKKKNNNFSGLFNRLFRGCERKKKRKTIIWEIVFHGGRKIKRNYLHLLWVIHNTWRLSFSPVSAIYFSTRLRSKQCYLDSNLARYHLWPALEPLHRKGLQVQSG